MQKYTWSDKPSETAYPVAKAGFPFIFTCGFVTAVFALIGIVPLAIAGLVATLYVCYFFRDPDRVIPSKEGAVVSPADGKVVVAETVSENPYVDGPCKKISVFMNVFNVHVNRVPHEGVVKKIMYFPGRFFNASLDKASEENEHNAVVIETGDGKTFCTVQIAGLVARRIICRIQEGEEVKRGSRFGMICFGSRLDVYLPDNAELSVSVGDKVQAGTSILGFLK